MQLTRKTEYAVRTLLELLGRPPGEMVQTCDIAEARDIPEPFLNKTIRDLARAGFVETRRGKMGGVRMNKQGGSFTMVDVIEAIEGPLAINPCLREGYSCINKSSCTVRQFLQESQSRFVDHLKSRTFAELAERDGGNK